MSTPKSEDLLEMVLRESANARSVSASRSAGEIDVPRLLEDLAAAGRSPLGEQGRETLEMLCRKLSVAKQVCRSYRGDWRKMPDPALLGGRDQALLIAVLLTRASTTGAGDRELAHAVKYLSAALDGLDLARESGEEVPHLASLGARADEILESLTAATGGAP